MSRPFVLLVGLAILLALAERIYAARNERRLLRAGGREVAPWVYRTMAPVYSALFLAALAEHLQLERRVASSWLVVMAALFLAAKGLKLWAVVQLGGAWTMKVVLPHEPKIVATGPYRFIRHPNYVAVLIEVVALPLAGGAWWTALGGGVLFAVLLRARIRTEEAALLEHPVYASAMGRKNRFLPGRGAR